MCSNTQQHTLQRLISKKKKRSFVHTRTQGALYGAIISMATVGLIIANTQIAIGNKHLKYEAIPASTEWCTNETIANAAKQLHISDSTMVPQLTDDGFAFYKISFMVSAAHILRQYDEDDR